MVGGDIGESMLGRRGLPCQGFVLIKPLSFWGTCVYLLLPHFGPGCPNRLTLWDSVGLFFGELWGFRLIQGHLACRVRVSGLRKGDWSLSRHVSDIHCLLMLLVENRPRGGDQLAPPAQLGQLCRC